MGKNNDFDNQQIQYDEWGDPVKKKTLPDSKRLYTDEWGDPVKKISVNEENREYMNELEKVALEKELVDKQLIYPRAHYLPRGRLRGIVAVCLAFIFGIFVVLGGLVGVGVWAGTKAKMRTLLGSNAGNLLRDDYLDMSVLQLITTVANDMKGGIDDLNDISKYTPLVDTLLDKLDSAADKYGITYDREVLKATKFSELSSYLVDDVLKNIEIGKVATSLGVTDPMVIAIFYGEEGEDFEYDANGNIVPIEGGREPLVVNDFMTDIMGSLGTVRLGTLMGLNKNASEEKALGDSAMLYALCYGKYSSQYTKDENGKYHVINGDYTIVEGMVKVDADNLAAKKAQKGSADAANTAKTLADTEGEEGAEDEKFIYPTSIDDLIDSPNAVINDLELGTMLGIGTNVTDEKKESNALMLALCYGTEGVDYEIKNGTVVMLEGHGENYPTTVNKLTSSSSDLIQSMQVETLMSIKIDSDKVMHYLAYGPEMAKGTTPYEDSKDAEGRPVDEHGYLLDENGHYKTEFVKDDEGHDTTEKQYVGGGTYVYTYDNDGNATGVQMLPDPNKSEGELYPKRTVADLTAEDAGLLEGMKIGDVMEIDSESSNIMRAMKDWTLDDLKDQEMINKLRLSDILDIHEKDPQKPGDTGSSGILLAMKDWTLNDLNDQKMIESLTIGEVLDIKGEEQGDTSNIMWALRKKSLKDLENEQTIERLRIGQLIKINDDSSKLMQALKTWRVSDLSKQEKIDSLKLSDVIEIEDESGILASLKDSRIGKLQDKIDTLTLKDMLGDNFGDNKILNQLADSTISTLSTDMENISIGELFADQVYSYMETTDGTYQELYNKYFENHNADNYDENAKHRPEAVTFNEHPLVTYYTAGQDVRVVKGFYEQTGSTYKAVPEGTKIIRGMKTVNDGTGSKKVPYYYYEKEVELDVKQTYKIYTEDDSGDVVDKENVTSDGYGNYFTKQQDGKDVEVELYETYKLKNSEIEYKDEVIRDVNGDGNVRAYYIEEVEIYERYGTADGTSSYEVSAVTEHYEYEKDGKTVQLQRYYSGVWFLLLATVTPQKTVSGDDDDYTKPETITFDQDVRVLDIAENITDVNDTLTDVTLWKLFFYGILPEDPYVKIPEVEFTHTITNEGATSSTTPVTRKVSNLNDISISELVPFIEEFTKKISGFGN